MQETGRTEELIMQEVITECFGSDDVPVTYDSVDSLLEMINQKYDELELEQLQSDFSQKVTVEQKSNGKLSDE